jgi:hypothetical protein
VARKEPNPLSRFLTVLAEQFSRGIESCNRTAENNDGGEEKNLGQKVEEDTHDPIHKH